MPSLSFRVRSVTATGAPDPQWWVVYYTDEHSPDTTQPFIEPQAERMFLGETCMPACHPLFQFETALKQPNWYACPESDHYWGDYFDVARAGARQLWKLVGRVGVYEFGRCATVHNCDELHPARRRLEMVTGDSRLLIGLLVIPA